MIWRCDVSHKNTQNFGEQNPELWFLQWDLDLKGQLIKCLGHRLWAICVQYFFKELYQESKDPRINVD